MEKRVLKSEYDRIENIIINTKKEMIANIIEGVKVYGDKRKAAGNLDIYVLELDENCGTYSKITIDADNDIILDTVENERYCINSSDCSLDIIQDVFYELLGTIDAL